MMINLNDVQFPLIDDYLDCVGLIDVNVVYVTIEWIDVVGKVDVQRVFVSMLYLVLLNE